MDALLSTRTWYAGSFFGIITGNPVATASITVIEGSPGQTPISAAL